MNKILVLFAVGLFALLYSCSEDAQKNQLDDATLYLTVQDGRDGSLLAGAKATLGATQGTTDAKGLATFKLQPGTYALLVEKENYAASRLAVGGADVASGGVSIVGDIRQSVQLYPATAGLKGLLFYTNPKGQSLPMPGVPIRVDITGSNLNLAQTSYDCDPTNSNGEYECKNLPAIGSGTFSVYALGMAINGVNYPSVEISTSGSLLPGVVANNGRKEYQAATTAFILMEYPRIIEDADKGKPLTLRFSKAVDTSLFRQDWVTSSQAINIKWLSCEAGCTQLEITPLPEWLNNSGVQLSGLTSVSGQSLTAGFVIKLRDADITEAKVEGLKVSHFNSEAKGDTVEYKDSTARITWNKLEGAVEGATKYTVLVRTSDTANFKVIEAALADTTIVIKINDGKPIGSRVNKVIVRAFNSGRYSKFSEQKDIKATDDGKAPTYASASDGRISDPCALWTSSSRRCSSGYVLGTVYCTYPSVPADGVIDFCDLNNRDKTGTNVASGFSKLDPDNFFERRKLGAALKDTLAFNKIYVLSIPNTTDKADSVIAFGRVFFNKPMNTSLALKVACAPATDPACDKLVLTQSWNNDQNLGLTITTVAGKAVTTPVADHITFSITGLKGANNEDFVASPSADPVVNAVKIKFATQSYCDTQAGQTDYTRCGNQICNANPNETANCTGNNDYCTNSGKYNDYDRCKLQACQYSANNAACASYCPTSNATICSNHCNFSDYKNTTVCGGYFCQNASSTNCVTYCNNNSSDTTNCPTTSSSSGDDSSSSGS